MKRILITGGAGFIGSHLAERLLERGDHVTALDNFNTYYDPAIKRGNIAQAQTYDTYQLLEGDITDEDTVKQAFADIEPEVVVHLAARAGVRPSLEDPNLYHRVNVIGSQHILDCCRTYQPENLVFASSSSVYGGIEETPFHEGMDISRTISPYAATKRMNELQAHVYSHIYGVKVSMMRFFTVYGPRQRPDMAIHKFIRMVMAGEPIPMFGDGTTRRDYTYIDDILDGLVKSVDTPFPYEVFNLGESHTTSLRELIDLVSAAVGKEAIIEQQDLQPGDVTITYANVDKAKELLGYAPCTGMEEGLAKTVAWFREQGL